jgi:hypothetical protein
MTCKGINISAELENNIRTLSIFDVLFLANREIRLS